YDGWFFGLMFFFFLCWFTSNLVKILPLRLPSTYVFLFDTFLYVGNFVDADWIHQTLVLCFLDLLDGIEV
ncbi:hypothetical protein M569_05659, partial [Genlisea aurea]